MLKLRKISYDLIGEKMCAIDIIIILICFIFALLILGFSSEKNIEKSHCKYNCKNCNLHKINGQIKAKTKR